MKAARCLFRNDWKFLLMTILYLITNTGFYHDIYYFAHAVSHKLVSKLNGQKRSLETDVT